MELFEKTDDGAPEGFFAVEAAGLAWLADAAERGGAPAPRAVRVSPTGIALPRLEPVRPSPQDAERFGRQLAATHAAGAPHHGAPPAGWDGDGFIATLPLPHVRPGPDGPRGWGAFYAQDRVRPYLRSAHDAGALEPGAVSAVEELCAALAGGAFDDGLPPARLHGDLWSGNVVWTARGAVLVDPAAHGGSAETDLAMLALFGLPHLERVLAAYEEAAGPALAPGWRERVPLHQLHPLLVHAVLFGGSYGAAAGGAARRALAVVRG